MLLAVNSLLQGILQRIFLLGDSKTSDYAQNERNRTLRQGREQGIQGISPQATEELGVTCRFERRQQSKQGSEQGKKGMPGLTVQLGLDETGISLIKFSTETFPKALRREGLSEERRLPRESDLME